MRQGILTFRAQQYEERLKRLNLFMTEETMRQGFDTGCQVPGEAQLNQSLQVS